MYCSNLNGLGKTTFAERAFHELQLDKHGGIIQEGLRKGIKISIDFSDTEKLTAFELEKIGNEKYFFIEESTPLLTRLLSKYFGCQIGSIYEILGSKEKSWKFFYERYVLEPTLYKICQNLGENSIIYVHIDEPQLLEEQLNSVCEKDTSIEIVKSFIYKLCCCAKPVFQKANVYLCVIVTGTFSYLSLLPERVDPHYLNLSLLNSKDDYLSKLFSKQKGFNQVVQKPIFTAYLEAFGLIPFLLPKIVEYFREISFREFNYQHFHSVLSNILTNTIQLVDIVKDNKFLINLCYCSLLREQIIMVYSPLVNKIRSSGMFLELKLWGRNFPKLLIPMIIQITRQITEEIENSTPLFLVEKYFTYEISYFEKQVAATIIIRAGLKYLENITYFKAIYPGCTNFSIFNRELIFVRIVT